MPNKDNPDGRSTAADFSVKREIQMIIIRLTSIIILGTLISSCNSRKRDHKYVLNENIEIKIASCPNTNGKNDDKNQSTIKKRIKNGFDFQNKSAIVFINMLKKRQSAYSFPLTQPHIKWPKEEDIPLLIKLINSKEKCVPVASAIMSGCPPNESTVGREAMFLLYGFFYVYPPNLCSGKEWFHPNKKQILKRWEEYKKKKFNKSVSH